MDRKRIWIVAVSLLVVILVLVWAGAVKRLKQKGAQLPKAAGEASTQIPSLAIAKKQLPEEKLDWTRDPFSGKIYSLSQGEGISLELKGIFWEKRGGRALIGNNIVKEGDVVGQYTIIGIGKKSVIADNGRETIELKMK